MPLVGWHNKPREGDPLGSSMGKADLAGLSVSFGVVVMGAALGRWLTRAHWAMVAIAPDWQWGRRDVEQPGRQ